ncbi:hypothetical protein AB0346_29370 [Nocardia beijingensis]|uniref:hypothetical protein n=1 Tax=Nocardia beijingensis TaxID=95162 RepID=UPI00344F48EA
MAVANNDYDAKVRAAMDNLRSAIADTRNQLNSYRQRNQPSAELLQHLQDKASSGDLGADMQALADLVASGRETWMNLFTTDTANSALLHSHLDRMYAEHGAAVRAALQSDASFDRGDDLYK